MNTLFDYKDRSFCDGTRFLNWYESWSKGITEKLSGDINRTANRFDTLAGNVFVPGTDFDIDGSNSETFSNNDYVKFTEARGASHVTGKLAESLA